MAKKIKPEAYILIGIPVLFLIGGLFHFLFSLCGEPFVLGLFVPVNESVFEHIKMAVLPVFLWWVLFYLFRKDGLRADALFTAALLSMLLSIISMPMLFYFYTEAFGIESLIIDIFLLLVTLGLAQLLGLHYYRHGKGMDWRLALPLMIVIIILVAVLTVAPPKIPLFKNAVDGSYGILKTK